LPCIVHTDVWCIAGPQISLLLGSFYGKLAGILGSGVITVIPEHRCLRRRWRYHSNKQENIAEHGHYQEQEEALTSNSRTPPIETGFVSRPLLLALRKKNGLHHYSRRVFKHLDARRCVLFNTVRSQMKPYYQPSRQCADHIQYGDHSNRCDLLKTISGEPSSLLLARIHPQGGQNKKAQQERRVEEECEAMIFQKIAYSTHDRRPDESLVGSRSSQKDVTTRVRKIDVTRVHSQNRSRISASRSSTVL
jgi:hypothetical protein